MDYRHQLIYIHRNLSRLSIVSNGTTTSVAKGSKFRPQNPKGAAEKYEWTEKLVAKYFLDLQKKRSKKGPNCFKTLNSGTICRALEINSFLTHLYPHILLQFVSFKLVFSSKNKFSCGTGFFLPSGRIFYENLAGKFWKELATLTSTPDSPPSWQSRKMPQSNHVP
jgi:hypothetical protein